MRIPRIARAASLLVMLACSGAVSGADPADTAEVDQVVALLDLVLDADESTARECLRVLMAQVESGALDDAACKELNAQLGDRLREIVAEAAHPLRFESALLLSGWDDEAGIAVARECITDSQAEPGERLAAVSMLVSRGNSDVLADLQQVLEGSAVVDEEQRGQLISALGKSNDPRVAEVVLSQYPRLSSDLRPRAIELLTQRPEWSTDLLAAIRREEVGKDALNLNQLRRLNSFTDDALRTAVRELYGEIREGRDPGREQVVAEMREFLAAQDGDAARGEVVFKKLCGQCHKIHGEGADVGPDITRNGRNNWEQLLWNVLDPSQVIGPGFQARTVVIDDGRTLTGLPIEESDQRIVLKVQGGKTETIPRDQIELYKVSELSMMPDQLEKQLTPQELADLFQFLAHDRHPSDPQSRLLPGAPAND